jgi:hypothetical protein
MLLSQAVLVRKNLRFSAQNPLELLAPIAAGFFSAFAANPYWLNISRGSKQVVDGGIKAVNG